MCLLQYGFTNTINLMNTNSVLEPYRSLLILCEVWASTFSYQIFDLLNFRITDLTLAYFLLQVRLYLYGNPFSMSNYPQIELLKIFC
jgi:hypothetical protein